MKKHLLAVLSLSMLFFACSKENISKEPSTNGKKVPLKISITDFMQKLQTLPSPYGRAAASGTFERDSSLNGTISDIYFYIFIPTTGIEYARIHQRSQDPNFGVINEFIPDGNYTVVAIASSDSLFVLDQMSVLFPKTADNKIVAGYPDIFRGSTEIVVNGNDSVSIEMLLQRQTALLEVNITDAPASADSVVKVNFTPECSSFDPFTGSGNLNGFTDTLEVPRRSQTTFNSFVLNTNEHLTVEITYPDRSTGVTLTKRIRNVIMNKNAKTLLTGSLYATPPTVENPNNGFNIRINNIWDPTQVINF